MTLYCLHSIVSASAVIDVEVEDLVFQYRGLYILCKDFNAAFGIFLIPTLKLALIILYIFSFFAVVRLWNILNVFSFALVFATTFTSGFMLIPISILMSSFFDSSAQFQKSMEQIIQRIPDKRIRLHSERQLKCCSPIRCQVGSLYHMEAKAKLTMLQHIVNGVVFLLVNVRV